MSVFTLASFCLITSNLPWIVDLTFQVSMQYCSLQHWTLFPPDTSTAEHCFCFGPATSFFLDLLVITLCSSLVAYWTLSDLGAGRVSHLLLSYLSAFSYYSWASPGKNTGMACRFTLHQWTTFCQNASLCPVCLGWPCMAWLIASLSYTSPFAVTRLWSMKRILLFNIYMYAAAKSLQSCPTLCNPIDSSPPGSSVHGILQARTLE